MEEKRAKFRELIARQLLAYPVVATGNGCLETVHNGFPAAAGKSREHIAT